MKICKYGSEILKKRAATIKNIDDRIVELSRLMTETMHLIPGVGLAAPQIGKSLQLATVDISVGQNPEELLILINPTILEVEKTSETADEGCLSIPGYSLPIKRNQKVFIQSLTLDGKEIRREFSGFKARVIQHEIDHLNGILILDHISQLKRSLIKQEIRRLSKSGKW